MSENTIEKLKENYEKAVTDYIKEFEKVYEVDFDFWVGDEVGGVANIGDETYNFSDLKYMIDNSIKYDFLVDWYYFVLEYNEKCYYNLDAYCRLRRDAENKEHFSLDKFEKDLLYMRIKE